MFENAPKLAIRRSEWIVLAIASVIFLTSLISPPGLMDDVEQLLVPRLLEGAEP